MTFVPNDLSVRERILRRLKESFEAQSTDESDPYDFAWDQVYRGPPDDYKRGQGNVLSIIEEPEGKVPGIGFMVSTLTLALQFYTVSPRRENGSVWGNKMITNIQRKLREDIHVAGMADNIVETGNNMIVDGQTDVQVTGAVFVNVQYKHDEADPRRLFPSRV